MFFNNMPLHKLPSISFGKMVTKVEVFINKVKVQAIVDTGAPVNVISSQLAKRIKMAPDLPYNKTYGTAGLNLTTAVGAYSSLPMRFGKFVVSAPAIILPNKSYNILIGTQFLKEFKAVINYKEKYLSLLTYQVPLIILGTPDKTKMRTCYIKNTSSISSLTYTVDKTVKPLPPLVESKNRIPIYVPYNFTLESGQQQFILIKLQLEVP